MSRRWIWMGSLLVMLCSSCTLWSAINNTMPLETNPEMGTYRVMSGAGLQGWIVGSIVISIIMLVLTRWLVRVTLNSDVEKKKALPLMPLDGQDL